MKKTVWVFLSIIAGWYSFNAVRSYRFQVTATASSAALMYSGPQGIENHCSAVAFEKYEDQVLLATAKHCLLSDDWGNTRHTRIPNGYLLVSFTANELGPFYPVVASVLSKTDDVAIIKIINAPDVVISKLGSEYDLIAGDEIEDIGFPLGLGKVKTFGRFVSPYFYHTPDVALNSYGWERAMPADITVAPGASGSGVFDLRTRTVIGIVVAQLGYGNFSLLEPISVVKALRKTLDTPVKK